MFKVVTDQLKVAQGWVRCGHCTEVFDASLYLQTTQNPIPDAPPASKIDADFKAPVEPAVSVVPSSAPEAEPVRTVQHVPDSVVSHAVGAEVELLESAQIADTGPVSELPDVLSEASPDDDVSFVRDSRRQAFWRGPAVRFALGLSGLLLAAVLLVQFSVQQRNRLAAMEPWLKPWLQMLCEPLQCDIAPLRYIEGVVIDSSSFNKINSDFYRLSFALKNTGTIPLAMPSLEVTLTDIQEHAVVRRVVTPAQFGVTDGSGLLNAGSDFSGVVVMHVLDSDALSAVGSTPPVAVPLRVAGYRVLAFYP